MTNEKMSVEDIDKAGYKRGFQDCERMIKEEPWRFHTHLLERLKSEGMRERVARKIAIQSYHDNGLETMSYAGEADFANREWPHYENDAQAALNVILEEMGEKV